MFTNLRRYLSSMSFDPSTSEEVREKDLKRILQGKAICRKAYFIVCRTGLKLDTGIKIRDIENVIDNVLDKSIWFGKFLPGDVQIIVPFEYDLRISPNKKLVYLEATERARYYGSGNLQLDKDYGYPILGTDVDVRGLQEIVISACGKYAGNWTLNAWK